MLCQSLSFKIEIVVVNLGNLNDTSEVVHSTLNQLHSNTNERKKSKVVDFQTEGMHERELVTRG